MVKGITCKQVEWLLEGLEIEQKKAHHEVKIKAENVAFRQLKCSEKAP
jgi:transposase